MLLDVTFVLVGLTLLVVGADRFVIGASDFARRLGISPLIIGLTIVGIATSAPEALVGSVAAFNNKTSLAIGNAIGSNIANIGLVLGVTVLFRPLLIKSLTLQREYIFMMAAIGITALVFLNNDLSRMDGIFLVLSLIVLMWWIVRLAGKDPVTDPLAVEYAQEMEHPGGVGKSIFLFFFGLVLLLGGAELLVRGAVAIAQSFGVSDLIIGLTIVAIGTSLPELAASISSVLKNEADIAIGNIIGSNMFNMLMVLGIPAMIQPTRVGSDVLMRDFPIMLVLTVTMGWMVFINGKGEISRAEGGVLFSCFIGYQYLLFHTIAT